MDDELWLPVTDPTGIGQARREVSDLCRRLGFDETEVGKVAIVVTELSSNLVKHAGGGELFACALQDGALPGVQVMALDHGPGIADPIESLQDGFSTAGTAGHGLGAVSRLAVFFDFYSRPGQGTTALAEVRARRGAHEAERFDIGAVSVPMRGERICGDAWAVRQWPGGLGFIVADGLGHGSGAADASREAVQVFEDNAGLSPDKMVQEVHAALMKTRGAAVAVGELNLEPGLLRYAGIGNISGQIITPAGVRNLVSHNGTAGHQARRVQEFAYPWTPDSILILYSDGIATHWDLDKYPGLLSRRASLIAGQLYSDYSRRRDDATVLVVREKQT